MPITTLPAAADTTDEQMLSAARSAGLADQALQEVIECWDVIQTWRRWIESRCGPLSAVRHRGQGDDPPDLELVFPSTTVPMEHTWLLPFPLGWAEDLKGKMFADVCSNVPSVSQPPRDRAELIEMMGSLEGQWSDVAADGTVLARHLATAIRKKIGCLPRGGIIALIDRVSSGEHDRQMLQDVAADFIRSKWCPDFQEHVLIVFSRWNPIQFRSSLITSNATETMRSER